MNPLTRTILAPTKIRLLILINGEKGEENGGEMPDFQMLDHDFLDDQLGFETMLEEGGKIKLWRV